MKTIFDDGAGAVLKTEHLNLDYKFRNTLIAELVMSASLYEFGRYVGWVGDEDLNYHYSHKDHVATGWERTPSIKKLSEDVRQFLQAKNHDRYFNHVLLNHYEPQHSINQHKDNEPELVGPLASFSLGASAEFTFSRAYKGGKTYRITLEDGDLVIGSRKFFTNYYHAASKPDPHTGDTGAFGCPEGHRLNLTWRTVR